MGINARIQSENGDKIQELYDINNLVVKLLPSFNDESSICLRFIDPYGNTVFNQRQLPVFIIELKSAIAESTNLKAINHGDKLLKLAEKADGKVHTYLKFIGD